MAKLWTDKRMHQAIRYDSGAWTVSSSRGFFGSFRTLFFGTMLLATGLNFATTLQEADLVGEWITYKPILEPLSRSDYLPTTHRLLIDGDWNVQLHRQFGSGNQQILKAPPQNVSFQDDLLIIDFDAGREKVAFKLVLAGWQSADTKLQFGTLYLYDDGELFNGIVITLKSLGANPA